MSTSVRASTKYAGKLNRTQQSKLEKLPEEIRELFLHCITNLDKNGVRIPLGKLSIAAISAKYNTLYVFANNDTPLQDNLLMPLFNMNRKNLDDLMTKLNDKTKVPLIQDKSGEWLLKVRVTGNDVDAVKELMGDSSTPEGIVISDAARFKVSVYHDYPEEGIIGFSVSLASSPRSSSTVFVKEE